MLIPSDAVRALALYVGHIGTWSESVNDSMERHGAELIDRGNDAECQAFLADVGRATLEKRHKRETAIAAATLQLEMIGQDLGLAGGH